MIMSEKKPQFISAEYCQLAVELATTHISLVS